MNRPLPFIKTYGIIALGLAACGNQPEEVANDDLANDSLMTETEIVDDSLNIDEEAGIDTLILQGINQFIDAALEGDQQFLADNTEYPISRRSPLPGWSNADDFKQSFSESFDDSLIGLFHKFQIEPDIIDRTGATGEAGILNGALWFTPEGKLTGFNYVGKNEEANRKKLEDRIRKSIHPILKSFDYNLFTGTTDDYILRIDETEKGLRYAQWNKSFSMADEPDFILYDGEWNQTGSAGGWEITFNDKEGELIVKNVAICANEEDCGYFLVRDGNEEPVQRELDELQLIQ